MSARSPARTSRWCRRPNYPWSGKVAITVNPEAGEDLLGLRAHSEPLHQQALHRDAGGQRNEELRRQRQADKAAHRKRLRRHHARVESRRTYRVLNCRWRPQRIKADPRIKADVCQLALRYGPLVYNVETADQHNIERRSAMLRSMLSGGATCSAA